MAEFRKLIITTAGFDFLTQAVTNNTAIAFSRVVLATQNYTDEEIASLTALTDPMQAITNLGVAKPSLDTIQVTAMVSNSTVVSGYSYSSIGLFAKNANDEEVLFAVSGSNSPGDIPPNTSLFSARLELFLTVSNAEQITFTVDDKIICGTHGIYVGGGDMPDGYDIQIDPTGEALTLDSKMSDTSEGVVQNKVIKAYVDNIAKESTTHSGCFYRNVDGQSEWLNPPMIAGIEYRTTERTMNNRAVYRKIVHFDKDQVANMLNSNKATGNLGLASNDIIVRAHARTSDYVLPYRMNNSGVYQTFDVDVLGNYNYEVGAGAVIGSLTVEVWYYKR